MPSQELTQAARLVNTVAAARICAVSRSTIYRWVRHNRVVWVRTPTGRLRIYADTLLRKDGGLHAL